jgi:hypothetical protein
MAENWLSADVHVDVLLSNFVKGSLSGANAVEIKEKEAYCLQLSLFKQFLLYFDEDLDTSNRCLRFM